MARKIVLTFLSSNIKTSPFLSLEESTARWRSLVWGSFLTWLHGVDPGVERDLRTLVETGCPERDAVSVLTSTGVSVAGSYRGDHRSRTRLQHWRWGRNERCEEVEEMADAVSLLLFDEGDARRLDLEEMDAIFERAHPLLLKLEPPPVRQGDDT